MAVMMIMLGFASESPGRDRTGTKFGNAGNKADDFLSKISATFGMQEGSKVAANARKGRRFMAVNHCGLKDGGEGRIHESAKPLYLTPSIIYLQNKSWTLEQSLCILNVYS
jgi:hypothetical protein